MLGTATFHYGFTPDPAIPATPAREGQSGYGGGRVASNRRGIPANTPMGTATKRRLTYRERRQHNKALDESWLTDDRPVDDMNDTRSKHASFDDGRGTWRTYWATGRVTDRKQQRHRIKAGPNPTGQQHKDQASTPGGPACNSGNPMVKRGMTVAEVRHVLEQPAVTGLGQKLAAAVDSAAPAPQESVNTRLKRRAVSYTHEGLLARRKLEQEHVNRALNAL